jgi:hypothetical protein
VGSNGRAIAQAVSRWFPTAAARVRARVWSCGNCGGKSGAGADFLRVLRFPLPIFIPPISPQSPSNIWGWYNRPVVAAVPSALSLTTLTTIIIITIIIVGSNPTQGMDVWCVCMCLFCVSVVLCLGRGLATG